ncbi:hypothetical protein D1BOALGB6SA_1347 [Olavius sp. associated proteobacterium Delta 1]|nr:hypothetical protein D1BOALGB6SA_1347 [Olavius sp. associated proteobacterium Delta 1]
MSGKQKDDERDYIGTLLGALKTGCQTPGFKGRNLWETT